MDCQMLMCFEAGDTIVWGKENVMLEDDRILENLLKLDDQHVPTQSYFDFQSDLKPYMRKTVVNWMVEVCDEQGCREDVVITAVNYLDRVLTQITLKKSQLQLLAAACMFIASKFRDSNPITASHLVMYTDWSITISQLLDFELIVLHALKWELNFSGPYDFLDQILFRIPSLTDNLRNSLRRHASILIILCTVDDRFMACPPCLVSSACLCAAGSGLNGESWCTKVQLHRTVRQITKIDKETLRHYQQQIEALLAENLTSDGRSNFLSELNGSHQQAENEEETASKSDSNSQRSPCTPTDIQDIQLNS